MYSYKNTPSTLRVVYKTVTSSLISIVVDLFFYVFPIVCGGSALSLFWYALLCVLSSFAIILKRKRELVASLLLYYRCLVTVYVLWLFLVVP